MGRLEVEAGAAAAAAAAEEARAMQAAGGAMTAGVEFPVTIVARAALS